MFVLRTFVTPASLGQCSYYEHRRERFRASAQTLTDAKVLQRLIASRQKIGKPANAPENPLLEREEGERRERSMIYLQ